MSVGEKEVGLGPRGSFQGAQPLVHTSFNLSQQRYKKSLFNPQRIDQRPVPPRKGQG